MQTAKYKVERNVTKSLLTKKERLSGYRVETIEGELFANCDTKDQAEYVADQLNAGKEWNGFGFEID